MPSHISFTAEATPSKTNSSIYTRPAKKPKMSVTQTYFLAHSARGKLSREAARPDHDLRLLVGHANMLDSLMVDLANAEQEQERWFHQSVSHPTEREADEEDRVATEEVEEEEDDEADPDSDDEAEPVDEVSVDYMAVDDSDAESSDGEFEDDETDEGLTLVRTVSRHNTSPPELTLDADSDSEDEHMPASPPGETLELVTEKHHSAALVATSFYPHEPTTTTTTTTTSPATPEGESLAEHGFFIPSRSQPTIIAAF